MLVEAYPKCSSEHRKQLLSVVKLAYDPAISLLQIYLRELETSVHTNVQSSTTHNSWKKKETTQFYQTMKYYFTIRRNEILIHVTAWVNPENIMLLKEASNKGPERVQLLLHEMIRLGKAT